MSSRIDVHVFGRLPWLCLLVLGGFAPAAAPGGPRNDAGSQHADTHASAEETAADLQNSLAITVHKDGSVSLGSTLERNRVRVHQRLRRLIAERSSPEKPLEITIRAGDGVEPRSLGPLMETLSMAGIRSVSMLQFGEKESKTYELQPPELWKRIVQRYDPQLRQASLDELRTMLESDSAADKHTALSSLGRLGNIRFDRSKLLPLVRACLDHDEPAVRGSAVAVLASVGGTAEDVPSVADKLDDPDRHVRARLSTALFALDPKAGHPQSGPAIERLLADDAPAVQRATIRSVWGHPLTPAAEQMLINLSYDPDLGYDAIYYALSTRPRVRRPVAERLIELLKDGDPDINVDGRASWGISHHLAGDDCRDLVVDSLIMVIDDSLSTYQRNQCIWGLGLHGGPAAEAKLRALVDSDEPDEIRQEARQALRRLPKSGDDRKSNE